MFVFTFVAGLFTFQYDKPHFDPLPRLPPNRARTHTDSPVMSRSSFLSCRRFYHNFFCLCRMCLPFPSSWKILVMPDTSEGKPSEPPFLLRGSISPVPPRCLRSSNRRFTNFNPRSHEGSDSNFRQKVLFSLSKNCLKYLILTTNYFN